MTNCKYCGNAFERTIDPKSDFCSRCFLRINECPKKLRFEVKINIDGDPNEFYEYLVSFLNMTHYINLYDVQIYLPEDHQTSDSRTHNHSFKEIYWDGGTGHLIRCTECDHEEFVYYEPKQQETSKKTFGCKITDKAKNGGYDNNPEIVAQLCSGDCDNCPHKYEIKEQESTSRECDFFQKEQCINKECDGYDEECWAYSVPLGPLINDNEKESDSRSCENCKYNKIPDFIIKQKNLWKYIPICKVNDSWECNIMKTFRSWEQKEQEENNLG